MAGVATKESLTRLKELAQLLTGARADYDSLLNVPRPAR
jgi:hypothetical protein